MAQSQQSPAIPQPPQLTYVDRPEISETFADSLGRLTFDGLTLRMEFLVNRMDDPNPPTPPTGRALTACRVVLPLSGVMDMAGKLQMLMAQLQAAGVLRQVQTPPTSGRPN